MPIRSSGTPTLFSFSVDPRSERHRIESLRERYWELARALTGYGRGCCYYHLNSSPYYNQDNPVRGHKTRSNNFGVDLRKK